MAALDKMRARRWVWALPFDAFGRALDALWEETKLRFVPIAPGRKGR